MEDILKIYKKILKNRNYSNRTIEVYSHYLRVFLEEVETYPKQITTKQIESYLLNRDYSSISQQNQIIGSVKLFAKYILNKKEIHLNKIERPKKENKLPKVIDKEFLLDRISKIENLKHKAIISLAYSTGLRVSEVINLKIKDIDSNRMLIYINNAKGRKDRIVPLSENILKLLRLYYLKFKPYLYLFNGQNNKLQYTQSSCNKIVKKYLGVDYHFHLLRHSSFTSMLEAGTDIRIIQRIAGHSNIDTTTIYTHISDKVLKQVLTPL